MNGSPGITFKFSKQKIVFKFVVVAIASILLSGCGRSANYEQPPDTDITSSPKYNFSSFAGTVWKTKVKMALLSIELYTGKHVICLAPPDTFDSKDPNYRPVPGAKLVSVLPVGARVQIDCLMEDNGIGGQYWVIATIGSGTNRQTNIYIGRHLLENNEFIPSGPTSSTNWAVNPDMLEAITNAP